MSILICPVCGEKLNDNGSSFVCENRHSFDKAREGYVNLLLGSKNTERMGDSKESAAARRNFLEKGYYSCLKNEITSLMNGVVLDICCGEGYYDEAPSGCELYGFDLSKTMVRLASKRKNGGCYFVANLAKIPVTDNSVDTAVELFAPFHDKEFARVLKADGKLISVTPGRLHLAEIKNAVYDTPYENDEKIPTSELLDVVSQSRVRQTVTVNGEDLLSLFAMTPYFYRTSEEDKNKLKNYSQMEVTLDFLLTTYKKKPSVA